MELLNKIVFRDARLDDCKQLSGLMAELGHPISEDDMLSNLQLYLMNDNYRVIVADYDNQVVAMLSVIVFPMINRITNYARINSLVVKDGFRGYGIGGALLGYTENYAAGMKCDKIELTSGLQRKDTGAYEFYLDRGYENNQTTYFRKQL